MTGTTTIQPVDTTKVRIQINSEQNALGAKLPTNPFKVFGRIVKQDGVKGLYKGLDSALLRQIIYGTARLGLYRVFVDMYKRKNNGGKRIHLRREILS